MTARLEEMIEMLPQPASTERLSSLERDVFGAIADQRRHSRRLGFVQVGMLAAAATYGFSFAQMQNLTLSLRAPTTIALAEDAPFAVVAGL